jgi:autotransporter-associated beta strand protein
LQIASSGALPSGTSIVLGSGTDSGTLDMDGFDATVGGLTTSGTGTSNTIGNSSTASDSTLTFSGGSSAYSGIITDVIGSGTHKVSLIVSAGTLSLTSANTYSGPSTISGGTLLVTNGTGSGTGTSTVTLNGGTLGGSGTISGAANAGSAAHTIFPSASSGITTTLSVGSLTLNANSTLTFNLASPDTGSGSSNDVINVTATNGLNVASGASNLAINDHPTGAASLGYYHAIQLTGSISNLPTAAPPLTSPATVDHVSYIAYSTVTSGYIDIHRGFDGDCNDDGTVNFADYVIISNNYGQADRGWRGGDMNGDRVTNFADFVLNSNNYGNTIGSAMRAGSGEALTEAELDDILAFCDSIEGSLTTGQLDQLADIEDMFKSMVDNGTGADSSAFTLSSTSTAVPEPASLVLLGLGATTLFRRRRNP